MINIQLVREDPEKVKAGIKAKGYDVSLIDKVLGLDKQKRELLVEVEELRAERNKTAKEKNIEKGKLIKAQLAKKEPELKELEEGLNELMLQIPNLPSLDSPIGKSESDNKILREVGEPRQFSFKARDHVELSKVLDLIDFERGSKVAGADFYYLKNEGVLLELALVHYGMDFLAKKGFTPVITPDLARERYYIGTGYLPKGPEAQTYVVEDSDLGLIATAEVTLAGYHADEVLEKKDLPVRFAGYSHCFRVEAGGYGRYSKGLYRVHQFSKVEMFVYAEPEKSEEIHQELLALEEEFWKSLEIPYRVVEMSTGDLGAQAARKFDLEAWMPGRGDYGEVTSTSNTTDYQARRLNIKYKAGDGNFYVHTLNGTLVAVSRVIIAILENFQQEDGTVKIPKVLQKYTGFSEVKPK